MNLKTWYGKRGTKFIWQRGLSLLDRYSLGPDKAIARINDCVACLSDMGCAPTLFTPGIILLRNPVFIGRLQAAGAEIAVHSYQHVNLAELPTNEAKEQLLKAVHTFERYGIEVHGFRCPYLGYTDELLDALPSEMFGYSSNQAISWEDVSSDNGEHESLFFGALAKFYRAENSSKKLSVPWMRSNMLEIPVSIPDDLQLHDGLKLGPEGITLAWDQILVETHRRGELFNLIFHTEQAEFCDNPFIELIKCSRQLRPAIWVARLKEIKDWWSEKANFSIDIQPLTEGLQLSIICSPRATILVRGIEIGESGIHWEGPYSILQSRRLEVPAIPRPFVGLAPDVPESAIHFLCQQGYILDKGETAKLCGIYLDNAILSKLMSEVALVNFIEASSEPLVRFWRWPDGAKSALSITGDLDALTLWDYITRLAPN